MCGICGIYNYKTRLKVAEHSIKAMCDTMFHRGPNDEGMHLDGEMGIGMRRLSIIDIEGGHQPIFNEDRTICVILNGEIYNYIELRETLKSRHSFTTNSDTECILHLYEEYGEDFVDRLNGMFAIALWDNNKKRLLIIRDRFGIKPLFYSLTPHGIIFASEINALLKIEGVDKEMDFKGLSNYFSYYYFPSPLTIYKGIKKLFPAHMLIINSAGIEVKNYWKLQYKPDNQKRPLYFYEEEIARHLKEACKLQLRSDVPVGIFLSGGIDSSSIVATIREITGNLMKSFSLGFGDKYHDELDMAKLVSKKFGTQHREMLVTPGMIMETLPMLIRSFGQPYGNWSSLLKYFVSRLAKEEVGVALTGEGGDEIFAGYPTITAYKLIRYHNLLPGFVKKGLEKISVSLPASDGYLSLDLKLKLFFKGASLPSYRNFSAFKEIFYREEKEMLFQDEVRDEMKDYDPYELYEHAMGFNPVEGEINRLLYFDLSIFLEGCGLYESDMTSMMNSLEVRVPLLDNNLVDFAAAIPEEFKHHLFKTKYILRKTMDGILPKEVVNMKKKGFVPPISKWLKGEMKDYVLSILNEDALRKTGYFNINFIKNILNEHFAGRFDHSRKITCLVSFMLWKEGLTG